MSSDADKIELIFAVDSLNAPDVARLSLDVLGLNDTQVTLYGKAMGGNLALQKIAKDGKPFFNIETAVATIHFSTLKAYQQQLLTISRKQPLELAAWQAIADPFMARDGFTQACLQSEEYMYWQNAADPIQYQAAGRSYDRLPLVSNGLPSPLQKLVIDTSCNPGRRIIRKGFVEMVSHAMWFGRPFWRLVGEPRHKEVLASTSYQISEMPHGVTRLVAAEKPFTDETTAAVQDDLRRLLFGEKS